MQELHKNNCKKISQSCHPSTPHTAACNCNCATASAARRINEFTQRCDEVSQQQISCTMFDCVCVCVCVYIPGLHNNNNNSNNYDNDDDDPCLKNSLPFLSSPLLSLTHSLSPSLTPTLSLSISFCDHKPLCCCCRCCC